MGGVYRVVTFLLLRSCLDFSSAGPTVFGGLRFHDSLIGFTELEQLSYSYLLITAKG